MVMDRVIWLTAQDYNRLRQLLADLTPVTRYASRDGHA